MHRLQLLHGNRNNLLLLWTKFQDFAESHNISKRTITTFLQSLSASLRRILVEDQSMANRRHKFCSSGRKTCKEKQRKRRTEVIRQFLPSGKHKKATEVHWQSTIVAKRKSCFTTELLWKITTAQLRKLNEYKFQSIGFSVDKC